MTLHYVILQYIALYCILFNKARPEATKPAFPTNCYYAVVTHTVLTLLPHCYYTDVGPTGGHQAGLPCQLVGRFRGRQVALLFKKSKSVSIFFPSHHRDHSMGLSVNDLNDSHSHLPSYPRLCKQ
jgi:hypothetical protein